MRSQQRKHQFSTAQIDAPHLTGIAALHAEATGLRGQDFWNLLARLARRLPLPSVDVGSGLGAGSLIRQYLLTAGNHP
ncbi:MAG: hypothetical protein HC866_00255 [Leptolyngbyaceae cyanobacterium RU_5_1]|nr:hypothetical protein [Leptolyngbyaceae cyanobacterium RU_5_1]